MKTQKFLASLFCLLLSISTLCPTVRAQVANTARIERLVGLARVWGTVKYFHPYLAYREIDWDKALVEAIPRVNAARTARDYESALNQMFAVLNDKSTRAEVATEAMNLQTETAKYVLLDAASDGQLVRTENRVLIIDAAQIATVAGQDTSKLTGCLLYTSDAADE